MRGVRGVAVAALAACVVAGCGFDFGQPEGDPLPSGLPLGRDGRQLEGYACIPTRTETLTLRLEHGGASLEDARGGRVGALWPHGYTVVDGRLLRADGSVVGGDRDRLEVQDLWIGEWQLVCSAAPAS